MGDLREQLQVLSGAIGEAIREDPMDVDRVRAVLACCESVKAAYSESWLSNEVNGGGVDFQKLMERDRSVARIFRAWADRQAAPDRCRLGDAARRLIRGALRNASADEIVTLIDYAYDADEPGPRYWRGDNSMKRTYLGLDNLLVASKLAGRVQSALAWRARRDAPPAPVQLPRADLGPMGGFRRRST